MTVRKSTGKRHIGRAVWFTNPGVAEIRVETLKAPAPNEAVVRALYSGISRGTERLVLNGAVPESEWPRMRAPFQSGDFPFPVKYGYCATGIVEDGPEDLVGKTVFCLHPHQDIFVAPIAALAVVPEDVPAKRATLAANMETALNAHWDAATGPGDRIVVVGAGVVGLLVARIAAQLPHAEVTVIDIDPSRRALVQDFGGDFALPDQATQDADVVFHTSASSEGLTTAINCAGFEARVIELSWYGASQQQVSLGGAFHSRRLTLQSSQVGQVSASRRARWSYSRRLATALKLLRDPVLDQLVYDEISFRDAADLIPAILNGPASKLAPVLNYA
ncbi:MULTISPECIES: zinc-binding alcohol dehydrogenase [Filomicrobium]|uniref:Threonine dehydrogenase n=1 Tax=Filomicrobium insigne TaxID=418854 RepID=A0A1H0GIC9_9HYPH|nr:MULTISPECIES: zinc-binding alcohol dehydrogenase [Filomicrobium]MCV0370089.1 zinc-binding alcohol dehydrogenase [Filomicrobium sp.]SDO06666.1 Threonine dehydrogenase [Filomicrobium insigne]